MQPCFAAIAHGCAAGRHEEALGGGLLAAGGARQRRLRVEQARALRRGAVGHRPVLRCALRHAVAAPLAGAPGAGAQHRWLLACAPSAASPRRWSRCEASVDLARGRRQTLAATQRQRLQPQRAAADLGPRRRGRARRRRERRPTPTAAATRSSAWHSAPPTRTRCTRRARSRARPPFSRRPSGCRRSGSPACRGSIRLPGYQYCDLLLTQGRAAEVVERAEYALDAVLARIAQLARHGA